ncbi:zinc ribbon domain-containing protein [Candidatus Omnitrophota bacterium]
MTEANFKEEVKKLVELQSVDSLRYQLRQESEEKPARIAQLQEEYEAKKAHLKELEDKKKQLLVNRKEKENDLLSKEESITKLKNQLYSLKTNKEYAAMLSEIGSAEADKSIIEEEILKNFDEVDALGKDVEEEKSRLNEEEKAFLAQKKEVDDRVKEIQQEMHKLEAQRSQITPAVDKKILRQYERVLENRGGSALSAVKDFACTGCFMAVTPQVVNEIKMKDRIVVCEACSRILYIEDEV